MYLDKKRYKQILFNLLGNANKFTFKGAITMRIDCRNNTLITEVTDTGIGIKEEDLKLLFKHFGKLESSKNINKHGMGLGLTVTK
jgi:signal transduction histidine kinase